MKMLFRSFAVTLLLLASSFAQNGPILDASAPMWQSFTNLRNVKALARSPQGIWAATTGGVLFWDLNEQRYRTFNNTEGLSENETSAIALESSGRVWIGHASGIIDIYDPQKNSFTVINELKSFNYAVLGFFPLGDSMYIAHSSGISLYLISRDEVKETYRNLGAALQSDSVRSVFIEGRDIWAATNVGVARSSLDLPNLQAPESWTNYTTFNGLPSNRVLGFTSYAGRVHATCNNGIAAFNGSTWENLTGNLTGSVFKQAQSALIGASPRLYAVTSDGLYLATAPLTWARHGSAIPNATGMVVDSRSTLWLSTSTAGLFADSLSLQWLPREPDGPAANNITSIAIDQSGNVWCTSGFADLSTAFMIYDRQRWRKFSSSDHPLIFNDCRHVDVLQNGDRWISTWGQGIVIAKGHPDSLRISRIDASNGLSSSDRGNPSYPVVPFFKQDGAGNVWICNYDAINSNTLACLTASGEWRYFSSSFMEISQALVTVEIEKTTTADRIWVGTNDNLSNPGVSVIDYNNTLDNPSDDDHAGTLKQEDGLRSSNIRTLAQDRDGFMWIGTAAGLYYWFAGSLQERFGVINEDLNIIKIDPRSNKWIGTANGISVLSGEDNFTFQDITIENSPLVSSVITDFAFNPNNGDVWIATTNGISRLRTPFTAPKRDLNALSGYPNPFRISEQGARFVITNLAENSAIRIYAIDGTLIKSYPRDQVPGAQVIWDGRDDQGALVPSGVYLFMAFIEETGASAVGKVAVIRQ